MIINDPSVTVTQGEIEINVIDQVLDTSQAKAWHIDLTSKYARAAGYSVGGGTVMVHLRAREDTLYVVEALRGTDTDIHIPLPDDWHIQAECARYTCRIVMYKATYKDRD